MPDPAPAGPGNAASRPGPTALDRSDRQNWPLVIAAGLAVFLAMLDTYIVAVALPRIGTDFRVEPASVQWVALAYFLPMAALVLPTGRWLDSAGHRSAFLLGIIGFAVASLACAVAGNLPVLLGARLFQGGFAAMLTVLTPVLVTVAVAPSVRGRAMGIVTTLGPLGALAGPGVGGWLTAVAGWRWLFVINLPISAVAALIVLRCLPARGRLPLPDRGWALDTGLLGGAVLVVVGALTVAASDGPGWAALALVAVPLLLTWRRLPTSSGLTALVAIRPVAGGVAALVLTSTATSAVVFLVPFVLAGQAGASAAGAGLMLTALPLAMVLLGPVGGVLADRWGAGRVALAGAVIIAGGMLLLLPLTTAWPGLGLAWRLAILGAGMAAFVGPNQTVIMNAAPGSALATAGGASGLARSLGFGLGPAVAAAA
ncbi:MAG TPA: MFS transporter, partial [Jiangellales bacterium]|nr:MFS transporter [Jiangellales bacterium]